jgi:hypothetical protein
VIGSVRSGDDVHARRVGQMQLGTQALRVSIWLVGFWVFDFVDKGLHAQPGASGTNLAFFFFAVGLVGAVLSCDAVASLAFRRVSSTTRMLGQSMTWVIYLVVFVLWFSILCLPTTVASAILRGRPVSRGVGEGAVDLAFGLVFAAVLMFLRRNKSETPAVKT